MSKYLPRRAMNEQSGAPDLCIGLSFYSIIVVGTLFRRKQTARMTFQEKDRRGNVEELPLIFRNQCRLGSSLVPRRVDNVKPISFCVVFSLVNMISMAASRFPRRQGEKQTAVKLCPHVGIYIGREQRSVPAGLRPTPCTRSGKLGNAWP